MDERALRPAARFARRFTRAVRENSRGIGLRPPTPQFRDDNFGPNKGPESELLVQRPLLMVVESRE